jgi:hypothetical protein
MVLALGLLAKSKKEEFNLTPRQLMKISTKEFIFR